MEVFLTKYEYTRMIGTRATQIALGSAPTVDIGVLRDPIKIAEKEYREGTLPIKVFRNFPDGTKKVVTLHPKKT